MMNFLQKMAAQNAATETTNANVTNAPVQNPAPKAETPISAPAPIQMPAPVADTTPLVETAKVETPKSETAAPATQTAKPFDPMAAAKKIKELAADGTITLTDTLDGDREAAYIISGDTMKAKGSIKGLNGKASKDSAGNWIWTIKKRNIENPVAAREERMNVISERQERRATRNTQQASAIGEGALYTEAQVRAMIDAAVKAVFMSLQKTKDDAARVITDNVMRQTPVAPAANDELPF